MERQITLAAIASELEITPQALSKMMREGSTNISTLERIASILDVPVGVFFEEEKTTYSAKASRKSLALAGNGRIEVNADCDKLIDLAAKQTDQIAELLNRIDKKDARIEYLEGRVMELENQLKQYQQ